ncbi:carbohydrate ABC transporter permease [Paenibacillus motobuensis]|uniref:Carbohydrate ABC transporter permease n=1 Tax=Paenibacillus lutimineralis TaxID=2707005 RepID=A0A3S9V5V8_9BACL|nr:MULTISPECIES: carbohydrate ABC transporter permease [Paenibacillus]AZS17835.1 carbohydrate ABC transporter permease [Paenibacillus lutimineralis]MCM3041180.1 carbohydrate ABC transporter permease [Paenibacillus lutimineralis]MCM3648284.1 carbohydrate ABC transporter permease [Paenibacillus motobuensis]
MRQHRLSGDMIFRGINGFLLILCGTATLFPFLYVLAVSLSPMEQVMRGGLILWPEKFTWDSYSMIFSNSHFMQALWMTISITIIGTITNLALTVLMAYPLSKTRLKGRRVILFLVLFTMLFSGGMIPGYLVMKWLGLLNSFWSVIMPGAISAFNLIILKNFFQGIPEALEESARIDGCSHFGVLLKIVLPLSMPALATFTLFYAVGHWNQFFQSIMYVTNSSLWPIQVILRQMIIEGSTEEYQAAIANESLQVIPMTIKMAAIVVATVPILLVYPFLQKHFAKGVLLGSVKG